MKVKTFEELLPILELARVEGKKVVQCHGVFDILHPGHFEHLEEAKSKGDILVVTITPDEYVNKGPGRPAFSHFLRARSLASVGCVDYVVINRWPTAVEAIGLIKPKLYIKGEDYKAQDQDITGGIDAEEEAVKKVGGSIHFTSGISFSSTKLLNTYFGIYSQEVQEYIKSFKDTYSSSSDIIKSISELDTLKVLVVGDSIIDQYHYCGVLGTSPKDNIINVRSGELESFAGGVLAVTNHIANFCRNVEVLTCIGDGYSDFIETHLRSNVTRHILKASGRPTTVKRRFVEPSTLNKLFGVCILDDTPLPRSIQSDIMDFLVGKIESYDLVLVSDFGHGFFTEDIKQFISGEAKYLAVNTQTNSANLGFNLITKYLADYICIDELELRLALQSRHDSIEDLMVALSNQLNCHSVAVTRGRKGSLTLNNGTFMYTPSFASEIVDRVGAGDAYLSITALCAAGGLPMNIVSFIGNAVAALKVKTVCNRESVEPIPLYKFITTLLR